MVVWKGLVLGLVASGAVDHGPSQAPLPWPSSRRAGNRGNCEQAWELQTQEHVSIVGSWGCQEIRGDLTLTWGVSDLRPLRGIQRLTGRLQIDKTQYLSSLEGLESITALGTLMVANNAQLASFAGLRNLKGELDGKFSLYVENNSMLTTFDGLEGLTGLRSPPTHYAMVVKNNRALRSLVGLSSLRGSLAGVFIETLPELKSFEGLHNVRSIKTGMYIGNMVALSSLAALGNVSFVEPIRFIIKENPILQNLKGLEKMTSCTDLDLMGNDALHALEGLNIRDMQGTLSISYHRQLRTLNGLEGLSSVGQLTVQSNGNLRTLAALKNVKGRLHKGLRIESNPKLRSLNGLEHIAAIGPDGDLNKECVFIRSNIALESITALGSIDRKLNCIWEIRDNPQLASFQIFKNAASIYPVVLTPAPTCFPPEERAELAKKLDAYKVALPPVSWDKEQCFRCAHSCGSLEGWPIPCNYRSGRCTCPLGRGGPGCADVLPEVTVLPGQTYACRQPADVAESRVCEVEVQLQRRFRAGYMESLTAHGLTAFGGCNQGTCSQSSLSIRESTVVWAFMSSGSGSLRVELAIGATPTGERSSATIQVGYRPGSGQECELKGTRKEEVELLSQQLDVMLLYEWCVDSGSCRHLAPEPVEIVTCAKGWVANASGTGCKRCGTWTRASADHSGCSLDALSVVFWALGCLVLAIGFSSLVAQFTPERESRPLPLQDVSTDGANVVVTTWGPHRLHMRAVRSLRVTFESTGNIHLDKPSAPWRVRVIDRQRLQLLTAVGQPMAFDTSKGFIKLPICRSLVHKGWPLPVILSAPVLMLAGSAWLGALSFDLVHPQPDQSWLGYAHAELALVHLCTLLLAALATSCWQCWKSGTPLAQRLMDFHKRVREGNAKPKPCSRGADRAVRAGQLVELSQHFQDFIHDRNMYYVVENMVKPLTEPSQLSYAEYVGPSKASLFVSHYWGTSFRHFCTAIQKHAQSIDGQLWASRAFWICSLGNNQHRISEEIGDDFKDSSFYLALRSDTCQGTCMVIDEQALPLTRSWCLFELLQTIELENDVQHSDGNFQGLIFCTSSGTINLGQASVDFSLAVGKRLAGLRLQDASASVQKDQDMIDNLVREKGGFEVMNRALQSRIATSLKTVQAKVIEDFESLGTLLRGQAADPA